MRNRQKIQEEIAVAGFEDREQFQTVDEVVTAHRHSSKVAAPFGQRTLRVLVADDNLDGADTLSILVQMWGHDARVAYTGAEALQVALDYLPDVLLLDVSMPQLDGCELAERIRQEAGFKDALLIAVTGYADEAHRLLARKAGFDHFFIKSIDMSGLEKLLSLATVRLAGPARSLPLRHQAGGCHPGVGSGPRACRTLIYRQSEALCGTPVALLLANRGGGR